MTDPTSVSPIDLMMIRSMIEGRHINYGGLMKLRHALTSEAVVSGWDPSLFTSREAVLALVTDAINEVEVEVARMNNAAGLSDFNENDPDDPDQPEA